MSTDRVLKNLPSVILCLWLSIIVSDVASAQGPGYVFCAKEYEYCNFSGTKDIAYGTNGVFTFQYGISNGVNCGNSVFGDPIPGYTKSCFIKDAISPSDRNSNNNGPSNYAFCAKEYEYCNFSGTNDIAYGANGVFTYRRSISGGIACNNDIFGDPISGYVKSCFIKLSELPTPTITAILPPPSTFYNLIMRYSKNCLGIQSNQAAEVTCNSNSQVWNLVSSGSYFQLQYQNSGNCLSASSNHETDPLILRPCRVNDEQLWQKKQSGGYFQLANKIILAEDPTNMCPDARQWNQPIMQWPCKPWGTDDQLDNQLFCQTTSNVANCAAPAGVYVTNIQQTPPPYTDEGKPNTFHFNFQVTFSNTTGQTQSFPWFVRTFGQYGGQTPQQVIPIPPGTTTIAVGPWNIGRTCGDYTAKVIWIRQSDGLSFSFKNVDGSEYSLPVRIATGC